MFSKKMLGSAVSAAKSKKKRKRGNLFEDIGFSGSPDRKSKTMFGQSYDPGGVMDRLSARRNIRKARGF